MARKKKNKERPRRDLITEYKGWKAGDRCYTVLGGSSRASLCEVIEFHPEDNMTPSVSLTEITTGRYCVAAMMSIAEDAKSAKKLHAKWIRFYTKWKKQQA